MSLFSQSASCSGSAAAGIEGTLSGLANIVGLGPLVSSIPGMDDTQDAENQLKKLQTNLSTVTSQWTTAINNQEKALQQDEMTFLQNMITLSGTQQAVINEILSEKVSTNSLMIATISILVVFLILYDIL
jgi:predicted PurR-regulated permease PerM